MFTSSQNGTQEKNNLSSTSVFCAIVKKKKIPKIIFHEFFFSGQLHCSAGSLFTYDVYTFS